MNLMLRSQAHAQLNRAAVALEAGLIPTAQTHLQQSLRLCPDWCDARLLEVRLCLARREPHLALAALDACVHVQPQIRHDPDLRFLRAQALTQAGEDRLALESYRELTRDFPDDVRPRRALAALLLKAAATDQAIAQLQHVLRLEPHDAHARQLLTDLLAPHDPQAAMDLLRRHNSQLPDPAQRYQLARLLENVARLREAAEIYSQLLADHPDDPAVLQAAGELARDMGEDQRARRLLTQAVRVDRQPRGALLAALAQAHMYAGRFAAAGRCWWSGTRRQPHDTRALAGLLVCALLTNRHRRIIQSTQAALKGQTSKSEYRVLLAQMWTLAAAGRQVQAILTGSAASKPAPPSALPQLLHHAVAAFAAQAQEHPNRADTHYHLARCRAALRDLPGAQKSVQQALTINPRYGAARRLSHRLLRLTRKAA